jgi:RimJ/RimL family protein N-acetyltransferase
VYYGKRIRFRAPERSDLPTFVEWLNDPEVTVGLMIAYPMGLEDENQWFDRMSHLPLEQHPYVIEIMEGKEWRKIGTCGFNDIDWRNSNAEIGIMIGDKTCWNKGYGTEAMKLLIKVGFEIMNLHRTWLRVYANNTRAIRCYEKAGFVQEGRKREAEYKNGKYFDILLMSVLRPEWKEEYLPEV